MKSQTVISRLSDADSHGRKRSRPYVFTEQGIGMLSGILKNDTTIQVNIGIMNAFVEMRQFLSANKDIYTKLISMDNRILEHNLRFDQLFELL